APGLQGLARASDNPSQALSSGLSRALAWLGPAEIGPGLAWLRLEARPGTTLSLASSLRV
ncbi:hypothetical protein GLOTRDRAFT_45992, partial [Gloeophyllum trabeum ATCC 11539]